MILPAKYMSPLIEDLSRVCGDDPKGPEAIAVEDGFVPRVRG